MSKKDSNWKDIPWHHGDMMDYDGMGNHGRFPIEKNKKRGRK